LLEPRKYFAGFFLNDTFYCHGGIDTKGKILNEFISVNLNTFEWKYVENHSKKKTTK
jgi:Galactose oxidase, central domain